MKISGAAIAGPRAWMPGAWIPRPKALDIKAKANATKFDLKVRLRLALTL